MFNWLFGLRCPDCGERFTEKDQYCPNCGTDLNASNEQLSKITAQEYLKEAQKAYDRGTRLKAALSNCDQAIECDPSLAEAHNLRGLILDAMGRLDEAISSYQKAMQINPNFGEARENLTDAETEREQKPFQAVSADLHPVNWAKIIVGLTSAFVLVAAIASLYFLYRFVSPYVGPKINVVFEPDYSQVSVVDPIDLEKTAQLLTERSHFLGYTRVSFNISPDGTIIGKVPNNVDIEDFTRRIKAIGLLEFVDFGKTRIDVGTVVSTDLDHKYLMQTGATKWHTVVTNDEIAAVTVSQSQYESGGYVIDFVLTTKGKEIFRQYTTENIGSCLGIVLDKVVISNPVVNAPIPDGQGQISGNFTQESANELAMFLRMTPLPIPIRVRSEANNK